MRKQAQKCRENAAKNLMNSLLETMLIGNVITYQLRSEPNTVQMGKWLVIWFSQLQKRLRCSLRLLLFPLLKSLMHLITSISSAVVFWCLRRLNGPEDRAWGQKAKLPSSNAGSDTDSPCSLDLTDGSFPWMRAVLFKNHEESSNGWLLFYHVLKTQRSKSTHRASHKSLRFSELPLL